MDATAPLGASLAQTMIAFAVFAFAMWVTVKMWERSKSGWIGALCGIVTFILAIGLVAGPLRVLRSVECRGTSSYELCFNDD